MRRRLLPFLPLLAFIASDAEAGQRPDLDVWLGSGAAAPVGDATTLGAFVAARDPDRGAPSLVLIPKDAAQNRAPASTPVAAARRHLAAARSLYGAGQKAIRGARHRFTHDTGRGPLVVVLRQTVAGVDVFHGDIKLLLDRDRRVHAISGTPHPAAHAGSARPFALDAAAAIGLALRDLDPA
ncbi:MAG: hypothetical protein KC420_07830, partial [Myxococcales bacterium]|nr:hypothetical protein [Myxococcales bacterium]